MKNGEALHGQALAVGGRPCGLPILSMLFGFWILRRSEWSRLSFLCFPVLFQDTSAETSVCQRSISAALARWRGVSSSAYQSLSAPGRCFFLHATNA
jgi:hypothetical protein